MKALLRNARLPLVIAATFITLDLIADLLGAGKTGFYYSHVLLSLVVVVISYALLNRAFRVHRLAEAVQRRAQAELERTNEALQDEVAQRKQMEQGLRASEERFRLVLRNAPVTVAAQDTDLRFIWAYNQRTVPSADVVGKTDKDLFPPDLASRLIALKRQVLETGAEVNHQVQVVSGSDWEYLDVFLEPIRSETGEITGVGVATVDLTKLKRAEKALAESERKLDQMLQTMLDGIVMVDLTGQIVYANHSAARILEINRDAMCGKYISSRQWRQVDEEGQPFPPGELPLAIALREQRPVERCEHAIIAPDGERKWLSVNAAPLLEEDGQLYGAVASFRDVTARKQAEHALRSEHDRAQSYLNVAGVIIVAIGADQKVTLINARGCQVLGYSEEEVVGVNWFDTFVPPGVRDEVRGTFARLVAGDDQPAGYFENPILTREGEERSVAWQNVALRDETGRVIGSLSSGEDITERRRAEATIRHLSSFPQLDPNPHLEIDPGGSITFFNAAVTAALQRLGLEDDARAFLPRDLETILLELGHSGESTFRREVQVGSATFSETLQAVPSSDAVRIYAFDVTDQKRTADALRASEEKYRLLFKNMAEGFALYELLHDSQGQPVDWRILEVNDAYTRHTGIPPERIVGRRISELFPAAIPEYLPLFAQVVATQEHSAFETYAKAVGRHQRVITFSAGGDRFASTIEDITERTQSMEALRASEAKFATVFRLSPDAISIVRRADGVLIDVNQAFATLTGFAQSEAVGRTLEELHLVPSTEAQRKLARLVQGTDMVTDHELCVTTREGRSATVLMSSMPILVSGEPCALAIAHDITKRTQSEEALRRAQVELAQASLSRARLEERQRLARELHDSVSQVLYGISLGAHTALTLFASDRERALEALHYIISLVATGLSEMRALIFALRPEELELEGLVNALAHEGAAFRAGNDIEVELKLCGEPDVPFAIKEAVYRVAQEALRNAVKHARPRHLEVRLSCEPGSLVLEVCDDGVGFDPGARYPGHLGLRSMRERLMAVGGTLDIRSGPDGGTHVLARVPMPATAADSG